MLVQSRSHCYPKQPRSYLLLKFIVKQKTWALKPMPLKLNDTNIKKKKTSYSVKINVDINRKLIQDTN